MNRPWLFLIPVLTGVAPLVAQLTPEQRQQREWAAVRTTIGDTRQREAERQGDADPLRGLRCGGPGVQAGSRCSSTIRGSYRGVDDERWSNLMNPVWIDRPDQRWPAHSGTGPQGIHFAAFGKGPQAVSKLRPLGAVPVSFLAGRPTVLTLGSSIGGPGRELMIHVVVSVPGTEPEWGWMGGVTGDAEGRYLVEIPALRSWRYDLLVEVYDPDRPLAPFSVSRTELDVR